MTPNASHLFISTTDHWRAAPTADAGGGQSVIVEHLGTLRCRRRQPIVAVEGFLGGQDVANVTEVVYLPPGSDVRRNDELRFGDDVLDVHAVYTPSLPVYRRADCRLRQR